MEFAPDLLTIVPVPGKWIPSSSIMPPSPVTTENVNDLHKYLASFPYNPFEPEKYAIIPAMPATYPQIRETDFVFSVSAPLKFDKSPYSPNTKETAYRSGRRSCVAPCSEDGEWIIAYDKSGKRYSPDFEHGTHNIRLKGCGMHVKNEEFQFPGITLMESTSFHSPDRNVVEIRGVAFPHTSATELYVTPIINEYLEKINMVSGNIPLGMWIYGPLQGDESPLVEKSVVLMETIGDKRLENHLFIGIERMMEKLITQEIATKVVESVAKMYEDRGIKPPSLDNATFIRFRKMKKTGIPSYVVAHENSLESGDIEGFTFNDFITNGIPPSKEIIDAIPSMKFNDNKFNILTLAKLMGRLSWETGRCFAAVHRTGHLWGTYVDHQENELHCNAHCDNLVVLPPEKIIEYKQLVAPVDFDMAFTAECAINIWMDAFEPDPTMVTMNFAGEFENLFVDIAGSTAVLEGVSSNFEPRPPLTGKLDDLMWIFRDIMLYEGIKGYTCPADTYVPEIDIDFKEAVEMITLSLIESKDKQS